MEKRGQEIMSPVDQPENNSENTVCKVTKTNRRSKHIDITELESESVKLDPHHNHYPVCLCL